MRIVFIADFFADQVLGGGELNNEELISNLISDGHEIIKINSHDVTRKFIETNGQSAFIVANFINLSLECISSLYDKKYVIYEHDHKYIPSRNPGMYENFKAPQTDLVNVGFYRKASAVFCQSQFHKDIVGRNLSEVNLISLGGNLWSEKSLSFMEEMAQAKKANKYSIMDSPIEHKGTREAVGYCEYKNYQYDLISSDSYEEFLSLLGKNKTLVFFPKTPETLSRIVVEARMMGMSVVVNKMIGATREEWYKQKGADLIETIRKKRKTIKDTVVGALS